ncbi:ABC transporter ATP-binding protein/permease [Bdellovibrio sp. SKB1291214]|uniref:ABC transporter ATP-binding protein n=1 Tax=Bdellovibrio sp. SKB1291214 TaxID=1732569 RepID=UPI0020CBE9A4|nr:ABC transporter ATP-binding protein [Bdellovibrio sp. SKB1291214]UYL08837.1 ABC transporter ATP-binding protein/permease [Bdellovibrio sp. SKB1291214]
MNNDNFMNEDLVKTKVTYAVLFKRLWPYARREKRLLFAAVFAVFGGAAVARLVPTLIGYAIDHGVKGKNYELFTQVAFAYLGLEILRTCFSFSNNFLFQLFGNRMLFHLREDLMNHVQRLPLQFFNKTPTGRIVTRLTNDVAALGELFTEGVITVFTQFIVILSVVVALCLISWKLTLVSLFLAPVFIGASFYLSNKIRVILHEQKKKLSVINAFLAENLNGIKVVQLYNRVRRNKERFALLSTDYRDTNMRSIYAYALMQPIMNLFNAVTITSALYFGGVMSAENSIAIGSLIAFLMNIQDFIPPLREILEKYQQFQNSLTSAERIFTLMDEPKEHELESLRKPDAFRGDLEIRNLNFRYEDNLPLVLKNVNLHFKPGESIALVGRTGSGKSTFISLLQRFYDAPEDSIFVDGLPIERIAREEIRHHVGVVQQDNFIFRGTIRNNIGLGDPRISDEQITRACEKTGYMGLLKRTGRDMNSPVDERGANLSVGERQLIAFARILAFNPDILILDEATANIDSESEHIIQDATREITKGRTSIIIAHRLSTIEQCDRIVVLSQGEVMEVGSHAELMEAKGMYYQFASAGAKSPLIADSSESDTTKMEVAEKS